MGQSRGVEGHFALHRDQGVRTCACTQSGKSETCIEKIKRCIPLFSPVFVVVMTDSHQLYHLRCVYAHRYIAVDGTSLTVCEVNREVRGRSPFFINVLLSFPVMRMRWKASHLSIPLHVRCPCCCLSSL